MAIKNIVTRGYGFGGGISSIVTRGYSISAGIGAPVLDPIEIRIRDGIATKMLNMTKANGYYYNVGDIGPEELPNISAWPRVIITLLDEVNIDDDGRHPANTHYTNVVKFNIRYEFENLNGVDFVDRQKIAAKLAHDVKKFAGDYYGLSEYGCYQSRFISYQINASNDESFPVNVDAVLECEYFQQRLNPTVS